MSSIAKGLSQDLDGWFRHRKDPLQVEDFVLWTDDKKENIYKVTVLLKNGVEVWINGCTVKYSSIVGISKLIKLDPLKASILIANQRKK